MRMIPVLTLIACVALFCSSSAIVRAAPITGSYTVGGDTTGSGPWTLTNGGANTFSVLRLVFDSPIKFGDLASLSVDYSTIAGGIGVGSPRIALVFDTNQQILVHFGPAGSFADPTLGPGNTGNLLALTDTGRFDLSGIGGSAYTNLAAALAQAGNMNVVRASIIVDRGNANLTQTFLINGITAQSAAAEVPEPASLAVWGLVSMAGAAYGWRKRRALKANV